MLRALADALEGNLDRGDERLGPMADALSVLEEAIGPPRRPSDSLGDGDPGRMALALRILADEVELRSDVSPRRLAEVATAVGKLEVTAGDAARFTRTDRVDGDALRVFNEQAAGILTLIRSASLYAMHLAALARGEAPPSPDVIAAIVEGKLQSAMTMFGEAYRPDEIESLRRDGRLKEVGGQILVATHSALEAYLAEKLQEYCRLKLASPSDVMTTKLLGASRFARLGLDRLTEHYWDLLRIDVRSFNIRPIYTAKDCAFVPSSSWEGLKMIEAARHGIVHAGLSGDRYEVTTLMDAWYPFDFVRRWVDLFDAHYDSWVYHGSPTPLLEECEQGSTRRKNDWKRRGFAGSKVT